MVDLEPNVIDDVISSPYASIFHLEFLLSGKKDAANNFAHSHYTVGTEIIDKVNDRLICKLVDNCNTVQGFAINYSVVSRTESGFGASILEKNDDDYRKKQNVKY